MIDRMTKLFRQACSEIDARAVAVNEQAHVEIRRAMECGNEVKWRGLEQRRQAIPEVTRRAKVEAWCRIGEQFGLGREECEAMAARILNKARPN